MSIVEYPKWKYAKDQPGVLVDDEDHEASLEGLWFNSPAEALLGVEAKQVFPLPVQSVSGIPEVGNAGTGGTIPDLSTGTVEPDDFNRS